MEAGADQPVFILRIFEQQRTRRAMIALFLAVLEMVRMQAVVIDTKGFIRRDRPPAARQLRRRIRLRTSPSRRSKKTTSDTHGRTGNTPEKDAEAAGSPEDAHTAQATPAEAAEAVDDSSPAQAVEAAAPEPVAAPDRGFGTKPAWNPLRRMSRLERAQRKPAGPETAPALDATSREASAEAADRGDSAAAGGCRGSPRRPVAELLGGLEELAEQADTEAATLRSRLKTRSSRPCWKPSSMWPRSR